MSDGTTRRGFLKILGIAAPAAAVAVRGGPAEAAPRCVIKIDVRAADTYQHIPARICIAREPSTIREGPVLESLDDIVWIGQIPTGKLEIEHDYSGDFDVTISVRGDLNVEPRYYPARGTFTIKECGLTMAFSLQRDHIIL